MASYPSAIWQPAHLTSGVSVLVASLLNDPGSEVDAIETELGVSIQGYAGSLKERLDLFMDQDGEVPYCRIKDLLASGERKRMRAGVAAINVDDLTIDASSARGTYTFSPPLAATLKNVHAYLALQSTDANQGDPTLAALLNFVDGSGTTTAFGFRVGNGQKGPPASGTSFIMHWLAIEGSPSAAIGLP